MRRTPAPRRPARTAPRAFWMSSLTCSDGRGDGGQGTGVPEGPEPAGRPVSHRRLTDHLTHGHHAAARPTEVRPGVATGAAVVSHDPQVAWRDEHVEGQVAGPVAGPQVRLVDPDPVDLKPARGVTAHDAVTGQADDPLDVVGPGVEGQHAGE